MGEVDLDELEAAAKVARIWLRDECRRTNSRYALKAMEAGLGVAEKVPALISAARERDALRREVGELRGLLARAQIHVKRDPVAPGLSEDIDAALRKAQP